MNNFSGRLDRPFGPWLRGIAARLVLAHYRKQKVAPVLLHEAVLNVVDRHLENINLLAGDTWDDKLAALRDCFDALPEKQKTVIGGRYFDGLSAAEVAERFELTLEACKKRLQLFSRVTGTNPYGESNVNSHRHDLSLCAFAPSRETFFWCMKMAHAKSQRFGWQECRCCHWVTDHAKARRRKGTKNRDETDK